MSIKKTVAIAVVAAGFVGFIAAAPKGSGTTASSSERVVTDVRQSDMLNRDEQMLERMRASVSPNMEEMIDLDPMWTDPEMVRLQEENQAQLDRMIGRRP